MSDPVANPAPDTPNERPGSRFNGPAGLAAIVLAVVFAGALLERFSRPVGGGQATPPTPMPPLRVEGWLNTAGGADPSVEGLRGRWVVVDSWATYCGPCIRSAPKVVAFYERWRDRGVEIVGLTSEPARLRPQIEAVIDRVEGWTWPTAYGAGLVNDQLGVTMIPNYVLFNPDGRSVWRGHTVEGLEFALKTAMNAP